MFQGYRLLAQDDRLRFLRYQNGGADVAAVDLSLGVQYVVATFNGACMCLFRIQPTPGSPTVDSQCTPSNKQLTGEHPFRLGVNTPAFHFAGRLDDVAVYNDDLTVAQIRTHYEASGAGGSPAPFPVQGCP